MIPGSPLPVGRVAYCRLVDGGLPVGRVGCPFFFRQWVAGCSQGLTGNVLPVGQYQVVFVGRPAPPVSPWSMQPDNLNRGVRSVREPLQIVAHRPVRAPNEPG
ncbi:MAG TPA: hypothetical protein VJV79_02820 [Polyangiaceae bacterium]|nr:hypothetical protein [Polyangiaceae bacterium]